MTDFCMLLGFDYVKNIKLVGPKKSFEMMKEYRNIEDIARHIANTTKDDDLATYLEGKYLEEVKLAR